MVFKYDIKKISRNSGAKETVISQQSKGMVRTGPWRNPCGSGRPSAIVMNEKDDLPGCVYGSRNKFIQDLNS